VDNITSKSYYESRGSVIHGYDNKSFPTSPSANDYLTVSYYDDYDWIGTNISTYINDLATQFSSHGFSGVTVPSIDRFESVKGQVTGLKTKALDDNNTWLQSVTFYDDDYRPILVQSDNYVGGEDIVLTKFDFVGKVDETWQCHTSSLAIASKRIIRQINDYDHVGRLLSVRQQMTGEPTLVTIAENSYNEIGELYTKKIGNGIQQVDYMYNIRGWLTQMALF
jgi:hypothetical protein